MSVSASAIRDFLAFEGCRGATLPRIWAHVAQTLHSDDAQGPPPELPDKLKEFLWGQVLADSETFGLFCSEVVEGVTATAVAHVDGAPPACCHCGSTFTDAAHSNARLYHRTVDHALG
jgi:hypothetical protein